MAAMSACPVRSALAEMFFDSCRLQAISYERNWLDFVGAHFEAFFEGRDGRMPCAIGFSRDVFCFCLQLIAEG